MITDDHRKANEEQRPWRFFAKEAARRDLLSFRELIVDAEELAAEARHVEGDTFTYSKKEKWQKRILVHIFAVQGDLAL